jgi:tetratricopeptide (TPR) repeat protein
VLNDVTVRSGGFGGWLRSERKAAELTQEELAERSGLSVRAISDLESGRTRRPQPGTVRRLDKALGRPAQDCHPPSSSQRRRGPALPAGYCVPRQLPAAVRHFTGRAREVAALSEISAASAGPAVVIFVIGGTAGVGKTALALHWAHAASDQYPDGQLYVNLRGYDPGEAITSADALASFLRALGVAGAEIPATLDERAALYRSLLAGRRMLVVLDNASSAEQVRPLLPGSSGPVAVVTSRDSLAGLVAMDGAERLELGALPLEDAVEILRGQIGGRVDADPVAAKSLAVQCSMLPLALRVAAEIAASRPAVTLADLVAELADQQRLLQVLDTSGDSRTAIREVFSWSIQNLDADNARGFELLGLHPGADHDVYAVAALTGGMLDSASIVLDRLRRAHLVQPVSQGRYGMHDLLRAYARELAATTGDQARRIALTRLLDHYLEAAGAAMDTLFPAERDRRPRVPASGVIVPPVADPGRARAWLDSERPNLVAVVTFAAANGWPSHAVRLAATLFRYLDVGGYYAEAVAIHNHALIVARKTGDKAAEATALSSLGAVDVRQGRFQQAVLLYGQVLTLVREACDQEQEARTLGNIGTLELQLGRYRRAGNCLQQAVDLFRRIGRKSEEAHARADLAIIDFRSGRYQPACTGLQHSLQLFGEAGDMAGRSYALVNLGAVHLEQERFQEAISHFEQALTLNQQNGYAGGEAYALNSLGETYRRLHRHSDAICALEQSLALFRGLGDRKGEADALDSLGEVLLATGDFEGARSKHAAALRLARRTGDPYEQARAYNGLANSYHAASDHEMAHQHWHRALALYAELGAPEAGQVRAQLGLVARI